MSVPSNPDELAKSHRWHAVECNNRAWQLADQAHRSPAEDAELLDAAHAAAFHWRLVGNELNMVRAQMLLAHAHAAVKSGVLAQQYAFQSHAYFICHETADWELAFSHAIVAHAAWAAGDAAAHRDHYQQAARLGEKIADAEEKEIFFGTFKTIPKPV
jgi:hypothetical protein